MGHRQKSGSVKIAELKGDQKLVEFECNTVGRDCEFKDGDKNVSVSFWFNGPKLVEFQTKGSNIVKRRFTVTDGGDALEVEIIPISSGAKAETLHLRRVATAAHK